ncbi:MAG: phage shock envelope stress response protein PspM, partial [Stackebrandtia sp.]
AAQYRNSAAAHGWRRLEAAAMAFDGVAPRLSGPAADTLDDVRYSQGALRDLAEQIRGVEKSLAVTPPDRRGSLTETHALMVERFETGISAYEDMVGAAAQVVAEQGALDGVVSGEDPTMSRLNEATAKLSGLAEGIGQMREFHTGVNRPPE